MEGDGFDFKLNKDLASEHLSSSGRDYHWIAFNNALKRQKMRQEQEDPELLSSGDQSINRLFNSFHDAVRDLDFQKANRSLFPLRAKVVALGKVSVALERHNYFRDIWYFLLAYADGLTDSLLQQYQRFLCDCDDQECIKFRGEGCLYNTTFLRDPEIKELIHKFVLHDPDTQQGQQVIGQLIAIGGASGRLAIHVSAVCPKGHSKWQNIKATKGKNDMLKSRQTNYLVRKVKSVVKKGGFDLKLNKDLAAVQLEFKQQGLSLDAFNNALKRLKPEQTIYYDIIGPAASLFVVETETDSKNRMTNTIQKYLNKIGSFRIAQDSIKNRFEEKGVITTDVKLKDKELTLEQMEEIAIELDCEETRRSNYALSTRFLSAKPTPEKFYEVLQEDECVINNFDNVESCEV
ncbi:hypothetical protein QR680_014939 [Steinernema hermaphroditum]|uniref:Uncharacterized protein n=1 Tax=Steinernema hermaphroditum TaxID=289476 RepID=A0AA39M4V9_9BILA|nr:hypothetical protein QR680_014939 [Steinernema hermaphroditum]